MADLHLDPTLVEEQVRRLNRTADSLGFLFIIVGVAVGAAIGILPLVVHGAIPPKYGIATILLGALLGGVLGHMLGSGRAFNYRLRGQLMLGQLRLEQNVEALLAVSERPAALAALEAPEPMLALPEPPRIEEIIQAGLAMPEPAPLAELKPTFEWPTPEVAEEVAPPPVVALEEIAPLPAPEPEPVAAADTVIPTPSWAAALEQVLPAPAVDPEPAPAPEPEPAPAWALPPLDEPVLTTSAWAIADEVTPAPTPAPTLAPAPVPEPFARPDFGSTTPSWAPPAEESDPEPEPEPAPPAPAAHTDLSALSIAEIARLADAGSL